MFAGVQEFEITPPVGLKLMGYARPPRPNQGAHDPLMGLCIYLRQGGAEAAIVSLDLLMCGTDVCDHICSEASGLTGISADNIWICCSHTHSGPRAYRTLSTDLTPEEKAYTEQLSRSVIRAVTSAKENCFPACVAIRETVCGAESGIGGNRETKGGISDPRLGMLCVWDKGGALRAMMANYALHPTLLREENLLCSADYPGYMRKAVQEALPGCAFGFLQGASGDQSSRYFRQKNSFEEAERFGRTLGRAALAAVGEPPLEEAIVSIAHGYVPVRLRAFPPEETLQAQIREKTAEYERLSALGDAMAAHNAKLAMYGAECKLQYAQALEAARDEYNNAEVRINALRIGNDCLITVRGECFVEYGLAMKALSGARTAMVATLSGGMLPGYVCTPQAYARGGYEPDSSMLSETFGIEMTQCAIKTANSLF